MKLAIVIAVVLAASTTYGAPMKSGSSGSSANELKPSAGGLGQVANQQYAASFYNPLNDFPSSRVEQASAENRRFTADDIANLPNDHYLPDYLNIDYEAVEALAQNINRFQYVYSRHISVFVSDSNPNNARKTAKKVFRQITGSITKTGKSSSEHKPYHGLREKFPLLNHLEVYADPSNTDFTLFDIALDELIAGKSDASFMNDLLQSGVYSRDYRFPSTGETMIQRVARIFPVANGDYSKFKEIIRKLMDVLPESETAAHPSSFGIRMNDAASKARGFLSRSRDALSSAAASLTKSFATTDNGIPSVLGEPGHFLTMDDASYDQMGSFSQMCPTALYVDGKLYDFLKETAAVDMSQLRALYLKITIHSAGSYPKYYSRYDLIRDHNDGLVAFEKGPYELLTESEGIIEHFEKLTEDLPESVQDFDLFDNNGAPIIMHYGQVYKSSDEYSQMASAQFRHILDYRFGNNLINRAWGDESRTLLHRSAMDGTRKIVLELLDMSADKDIADKSGNTALHLAVENQQHEVAMLLANNHANVDLKNDQGITPFVLACRNGNAELIDAMLQA